MYLFRYLCISIGLAMMFCQTQAQTQPIKGHIYDSQTRQPLAGVILTTNTAQQVGKSDAKGYFEINSDQPDGQIKAALAGYKSQIIKINPNQNELNVQLEADGVSLNEVRVAGYSENKTSKETAG